MATSLHALTIAERFSRLVVNVPSLEPCTRSEVVRLLSKYGIKSDSPVGNLANLQARTIAAGDVQLLEILTTEPDSLLTLDPLAHCTRIFRDEDYQAMLSCLVQRHDLDINAVFPTGLTSLEITNLLEQACLSCDAGRVELLLETFNADPDSPGLPSTVLAKLLQLCDSICEIDSKAMAIVELLLKAGADVNGTSKFYMDLNNNNLPFRSEDVAPPIWYAAKNE